MMIGSRFVLNILKDEERDKLHDASIHTLEKKGVVVHNEELRTNAKAKGAQIENEIVYFSRLLVEDALKKAPSSFTLHGRNKDRDVVFGKDIFLGAGHGSIYMIDKDGTRRPGTEQDYIN